MSATAMGWAAGGPDATEESVAAAAAALASAGLAALGYNYVLLQNDAFGPRDRYGALRLDGARFPGGAAALAARLGAYSVRLGLELRGADCAPESA